MWCLQRSEVSEIPPEKELWVVCELGTKLESSGKMECPLIAEPRIQPHCLFKKTLMCLVVGSKWRYEYSRVKCWRVARPVLFQLRDELTKQ